MTKFASQYGSTPKTGSSPIKATSARTTNHEGVAAFVREEKSDLFLLGVSNFVGENTFYESGKTRDDRFATLVRNVTENDPEWVEKFIPWLRNEANMRSAAIVAACEYVKAGGPNARSVIASACSRADEPAEVLSYWLGVHGKPIPSSVKRGVGDAARRLYTENSVVKYDGNSKDMRFADVIQLAHIKPKDERQSKLFKYALDSRYGSEPSTDGLYALDLQRKIRSGEITREQLISDPQLIERARMTWESLSGLGKMDAAAWEAIIPRMGYMALLRNLRNFEQAGISKDATKFVVDKLSSPGEVEQSRQLPFRFWSAYKFAQGLQWAYALEQALDHSLRNVPSLGGRTLLLVDTSASMTSMGYSKKSTMTPAEQAALFGAALALKGEAVDWYGFADGTFLHKVSKGSSVLRAVEAFRKKTGSVGHGTNIAAAMNEWNGHDRIVLLSDMQTQHYWSRDGSGSRYGYGYSSRYGATAQQKRIPDHIPVFAFNLQGYAGSLVGRPNEYELGGLTDHTFKLIKMLELRQQGKWPWDVE